MSPTAARPRRRRGRLHPLVIAALTIAVIVAITYYAFSQSLPFLHTFTLHAIVDNSVAVRTDSPVRIAGVEVGTVENVEPAGRATRINFTVEANGQPVHTDATVRIRSRLFLEGGYYLDLNPGSPSAPVAADGSTIEQRNTTTPVQFYNVLSTFDAASRSSLERTLNTLTDAFGLRDSNGRPVAEPGAQGFKRAAPQLAPLFVDAARINRALLGTAPNDMEHLIETASRVAGALSSSSEQLGELVTGLDRTSAALASADGALGRTISGVDSLLQAAPPSLSAVDASLPALTRLARTLDPSLKVTPPIITRVTGVMRQLAAIVAPPVRGPLIAALRTTFEDFPTALGQLAVLFPQTQSVTDCLSSRVTPLLRSQVSDGALSTNEPVWQDFVHFLPRIAGASGNFDANGHWVRYMAGVGTGTLSLGSVPVLGQLLSTGPPGPNGTMSSIQGASPHWIGDLTASAFRPDVECGTQPLPKLVSLGGASDQRGVTQTPAAPALGRAQLRRALAAKARSLRLRGGR